MFNKKFSFMFGILVLGIVLSFFIPPSHKAAAQQSFNAVKLYNDTDEEVCAVLMTYTEPYWITRGWYCIGSNEEFTINNLTVNKPQVYFYAKSASRIWSEYWDRAFDRPQDKGFPGVIDIQNRFSYSFIDTDDALADMQSNIREGFYQCGTRVAQDCRSVALTLTTGQTRNDTLVLVFSDIKNRPREWVLEY